MVTPSHRLRHLCLVDSNVRPSRRGIRRALDAAEAFDARLGILGVIADVSSTGVVQREWEQRLRDHVSQLDENGRIEWVETVRDDSPEGVLDRIERHAPDLVVTLGGERDGLLAPWSRTPERILMREARRPVWVQHPAQGREVRSVLAAVDVAEGRSLELARRVIARAADIADAFGADLTVMHAWSMVGGARLRHPLTPLRSSRLGAVRRQTRDARRLLLVELVDALDLPVPAGVILRRGPATEVLRREVERLEADVVVLGHSARTGLGRIVPGDLADLLLGTVPASLVVVHADDPVGHTTERKETHGEV